MKVNFFPDAKFKMTLFYVMTGGFHIIDEWSLSEGNRTRHEDVQFFRVLSSSRALALFFDWVIKLGNLTSFSSEICRNRTCFPD